MLNHVELRALFDRSVLTLIAIESLHCYFLDFHVLFGIVRALQLVVLVARSRLLVPFRAAFMCVMALDALVALAHIAERGSSTVPLFLHFVESPRQASIAAVLMGDTFLTALHALALTLVQLSTFSG
jgi:hypothetical protein